MVRRVRSRLDRLEQSIGPHRCPGCRDRVGLAVFVDAVEQPDGTLRRIGDLPEPCTVCGEIPESITLIAEVLVEAVNGEA
jgi:hypothetical protein